MSEPAIRTVGLGKRYHIGALQQQQRAFRYGSLRETISDALLHAWRRSRREARAGLQDYIWAVRDASVDIQRGEIVGIIGPNGAGKSTFLKLLTRITAPTEGYAELNGRVGSLLEVGTGFHPELTGRDNVFLSGAILGMRRAEIQRKFDDIVEFAGIAPFIDTVVKHYSSGMYARLAFAVAAHLDPDILLVDEVLAVGDAEFQKRSLGKMEQIVKQGRTVVFVSHTLSAVQAMCPRVLLFEEGRIVMDGTAEAVIKTYLRADEAPAAAPEALPRDDARGGTGTARCRSIDLTTLDGTSVRELFLGQPFVVAADFEVQHAVRDAVLEIGISTPDGTRVATSFTVDGGRPALAIEPGLHRARATINATLLPRVYVIDVGIHHLSRGTTIDSVDRALQFRVLNVSESGSDSHFPYHVRGFVRPETTWHPLESVKTIASTTLAGGTSA